MEVRPEVIAQALNEFVTDMFSKTELNIKNATNAIVVKMFIHNKVEKQLAMFANDEGLIDVDFLEETTKEELKKLGSVVIPAIGTSYKISETDVHNLFAKIRKLGE